MGIYIPDVPLLFSSKKAYAIYPYDIVVFNNAIIGIWSALFLKVPVVGMVNDYTSMSASFHNFTWTREWLRRMFFKLFEHLAFKTQKAIIVNSEYLLQRISRTYGSTTEVHLLYKGIQVRNTQSPIDRIFQSPIKVLFVKADFLLGGLYTLIQALARLKNYTFELVVVGPNAKFEKEIESAILAANIQLKFRGPLPEDSVFELMRTCDLFVVPSFHEALGVANMEALSNGISVISSDQGGIPEVLNYGQNGWMVPPGDPKQLADVIEIAISNPALRAEKSAAGYEFVRSHFDIKTSLQQFVGILSLFS